MPDLEGFLHATRAVLPAPGNPDDRWRRSPFMNVNGRVTTATRKIRRPRGWRRQPTEPLLYKLPHGNGLQRFDLPAVKLPNGATRFSPSVFAPIACSAVA